MLLYGVHLSQHRALSMCVPPSTSDGSVQQPERPRLEHLWREMREWQAVLNEELEHFTGVVLLSRQEEISAIRELVRARGYLW